MGTLPPGWLVVGAFNSTKMKLKKYNRWTATEIEIMKEYYVISPQTAMGMLQITFDNYTRSMKAVRAKGKKMGLSKMHSIKGHFTKGHEPWNKGKAVGNHSGNKSTQFKKGHLPKCHQPVGSIKTRTRSNRFTSSGEPVKYLWIKIAEPNKWQMLHIYNWLQHHGEIPAGKILVFKDKDTTNCSINNIEAITRAENMIRNQNREKFKKTWDNPTDKQVIGRVAAGDPDYRQKLINNPALIEVARQNIILKRKIKSIKS